MSKFVFLVGIESKLCEAPKRFQWSPEYTIT
jgi:hypothetical protein